MSFTKELGMTFGMMTYKKTYLSSMLAVWLATTVPGIVSAYEAPNLLKVTIPSIPAGTICLNDKTDLMEKIDRADYASERNMLLSKKYSEKLSRELPGSPEVADWKSKSIYWKHMNDRAGEAKARLYNAQIVDCQKKQTSSSVKETMPWQEKRSVAPASEPIAPVVAAPKTYVKEPVTQPKPYNLSEREWRDINKKPEPVPFKVKSKEEIVAEHKAATDEIKPQPQPKKVKIVSEQEESQKEPVKKQVVKPKLKEQVESKPVVKAPEPEPKSAPKKEIVKKITKEIKESETKEAVPVAKKPTPEKTVSEPVKTDIEIIEEVRRSVESAGDKIKKPKVNPVDALEADKKTTKEVSSKALEEPSKIAEEKESTLLYKGKLYWSHSLSISECPQKAGNITLKTTSGQPLFVSSPKVKPEEMARRLDLYVTGNNTAMPQIHGKFNCSSPAIGKYNGAAEITVIEKDAKRKHTISIPVSGEVKGSLR